MSKNQRLFNFCVFLLFAVFGRIGQAANQCHALFLDDQIHAAFRPVMSREVYMAEGRDLQDALSWFNPSLLNRIQALGPQQVLLNVGGGFAQLELQYLTAREVVSTDQINEQRRRWILPDFSERAQVKSLAIKKPPLSPDVQELIEQGRLDYQEISLHEYALMHPASVDLLLDRKAASIYSHFRQAVVDMLTLLKENGTADIDPQYISFEDEDGNSLTAYDYLKRGTGFDIESSADWSNFFVTLRRNGQPISLPELQVKSAEFFEYGPVTTYIVKSTKKK